MSGLQKICKEYGKVTLKAQDGTVTVWLWDYVNNKARLKSEMTAKEIRASNVVKKQLKKEKEEGC
jgi:major membrane immunogen (membrane-anchored lipoprotein)